MEASELEEVTIVNQRKLSPCERVQEYLMRQDLDSLYKAYTISKRNKKRLEQFFWRKHIQQDIFLAADASTEVPVYFGREQILSVLLDQEQ